MPHVFDECTNERSRLRSLKIEAPTPFALPGTCSQARTTQDRTLY